MLWHLARFDMSSLDDETREDLEDQMLGLAEIEDVAFLRVAHDVNEPNVTVFLSVFEDLAGFRRYEAHPIHIPVLTRCQQLNLPVVHLDFPTDDDVADLP